MNETICAKGGANDRRRTSIIRKKKKKLKELSNLERKVRKSQFLNIIILIPTFLFGVIGTIVSKDKSESKNNDRDSNYKKNISEDKSIKINVSNDVEEVLYTREDLEKYDNEIEKVKNKRIVERYEERLKELRLKLKNTVYEESLILEANKILDNPSDINFDKLDKLINRLDQYKNNIKCDEVFEEEIDYVDELIEEDKINIRNSEEVYLSIDKVIEKVEVIDKKISKRVEDLSDNKVFDREDILDKKDEKYQEELVEFNKKQENIVLETVNKINSNINDSKRIQLTGISLGSMLAVDTAKKEMKNTGIRSSRRLHGIITSYLFYFMMLNSLRISKRKLKRFNKNINNSLEDILRSIKLSINKLSISIEEFKERYASFSNTLEYQSVLNNLLELYGMLKEKEYELLRRVEEEKRINDSKVYKL